MSQSDCSQGACGCYCGVTEDESTGGTLSDFNPTHEFRGLELMRYPDGPNEYIDAEGYFYSLPPGKVTELKVRPKPGEVWYKNDKGRLRFVDPFGNLVDIEGRLMLDQHSAFGTYLDGYHKLFNADGSPA